MIDIDRNLNIRFSFGDTFNLRYRFKNYELATGDKVIFSIKKLESDKKSILQGEFTNDGNSYVDISFTAAQMAALPVGTYKYDLCIMSSVGKQTLFFTKFFIVQGVAH